MGPANPNESRVVAPAGATPQCASEEQLESYAMGRLSAALETTLEEHLLICQRCQELLAATDEFLVHVRAGLAKCREEKPWWSSLASRLVNLLTPRQMWITAPIAAALLALVVLTPSLWRSSGHPVDVDLRAYRAAIAPVEAVGPAARPLTLRLAAEDLPEGGSWTVLVVDADGAAVRRSAASVQGGIIRLGVPEGLKAGSYWIRLMTPADPPAQVREYSLSVK